MKKRVAIVTGGASGIGLATCMALAESGFGIVVADLDAQAAGERALELSAAGSSPVIAIEVDVASSESVIELVQRALTSLGGIDVLVNAAGIVNPVAAHEMSDAEWDEMIDVHLGGTFRCCRTAFRALASSGSGAIVNVSSIQAHLGHAGRAAYAAAKAGIEGLTRALAIEWASHGIRVNAVAPGHADTPLVRRMIAMGHTSEEAITRRIPIHRLAAPQEIASTIVFLASPQASYVTGQTLVVDAGMTINGTL